MHHVRTISMIVLAAGLMGSACGDGSGASAILDGQLKITTSVAPITSIVVSIAGDRADIEGIVPEGTNSHTFEPKPRVAELLSETDVVFLNGLGLEEPTRELARLHARDGSEVVELGNITVSEDDYIYDFSFPEKEGKPNPHLWTDPTLARRYAEIVKDELSERQPRDAEYFAKNFELFSAMVDELDGAMRAAFTTITERKLLTYHDAYAYFARTYGWEVIGAIQVSDFEDPTPAAVADLIDQIRTEKVPAIFGSEVFPSPVLEQIGRETGVAYVDELRDDDLPGEPGRPEHSWLGLMRSNFITMTEALGGDASALRAVKLRQSAPDTARYPQ
ncbi:MAG TPA: metal ABC transporter substrate-binding protein [Acidimicrobiales bacterium]|nr:metal ABC transporter substrate-binding protein [Acidimicrobiales bacterium]